MSSVLRAPWKVIVLAAAVHATAFADDEATKPAPGPAPDPLPFATRAPSSGSTLWWEKLKPGEYASVKNVLFAREPAPQRAPAAAHPGTLHPTVLLQLSDGGRPDASPVDAWASQLAARRGAGLSKNGKKRLAELYVRSARQAAALTQALDARGLDRLPVPDRARLQRESAALLVDHVLAERKLFESEPTAAKARFGRVRPFQAPSVAQRKALEEDALRFIQSQPARPSARRPVTPRKAAAVRLPSYVELAARLQTAPHVPACLVTGTTTSLTAVRDPAIVGFEARIYMATHPVTGETWEDIGLEELVHTSIVAGLWHVEERVETWTISTCDAVRAEPRVTTEDRHAWIARFSKWKVANGCLGTYDPGDDLTELHRAWFPDVDRLNKYLFGATADTNGKRCRGRYGAYAKGVYGVNYVCHQACNAFTEMKWGFAGIDLAPDELYGPFGNLPGPISDSIAPCECFPEGPARRCCAPGAGCCQAPTAGIGSGDGLGLDTGWHPDKHWIGLECLFDSVAVPFEGSDEDYGSSSPIPAPVPAACTPHCAGKQVGDADGCGGKCLCGGSTSYFCGCSDTCVASESMCLKLCDRTAPSD